MMKLFTPQIKDALVRFCQWPELILVILDTPKKQTEHSVVSVLSTDVSHIYWQQ